MVKVLFVCMGNICRSPTAHGVFREQVKRAGLGKQIEIDSAGTGPWHVGKAPDSRARSVAKGRGIKLDDLRARQVCDNDYQYYDYILAMDNSNLNDLKAQASAHHHDKIRLFLDYHPDPAKQEVPDPYYGGQAGFEHVFDLVEDAGEKLLEEIRRSHQI
ncbi:MAG: low molecular weight phosphotyrosine protein phosphatase [Hahellaceae bacterium]|jgi:protein-tyrosine phosphatase|nr:low molecular weight phosphotyrosine protein phosphatase [Hahellaceae bacterium]MCP5212946.1 low molecular weight phosphotyrosine protein phosphatase [Hahellaceae bacterium]